MYLRLNFGLSWECVILGLGLPGRIRPEQNKRSIQVIVLHQRMDWDSYVDAWMGRDTTSVEPIYLISGQGGGSRADVLLHRWLYRIRCWVNLLLITAVSGSANGTGFYLGIKHAFLQARLLINSFRQRTLPR
ncbi:MAG: hypothetical protein IPI77_24100 [Saprospiraceae bacterium]|nr:hypothetical protein [Saprospiraceae bacterium]